MKETTEPLTFLFWYDEGTSTGTGGAGYCHSVKAKNSLKLFGHLLDIKLEEAATLYSISLLGNGEFGAIGLGYNYRTDIYVWIDQSRLGTKEDIEYVEWLAVSIWEMAELALRRIKESERRRQSNY